jgi:hypothetical protein
LFLVTIYFNSRSQDPFNAPKFWVLLIGAAWLLGYLVSYLRGNIKNLEGVIRKSVVLVIIYISFSTISMVMSKNNFIALFGDNMRKNGYLTYFSLSIIFFIIGILWFFIYPIWERRHYIKHYKGFIKENYKDRFNRIATLEFNNDFILAKDNGSESKILTTEIDVINEIPSTIFVRLKGGQSFILSKDKIADIANVTSRLKELTEYLKIKYDIDEKWEWK